jgi:hypothetical protein
MRPPVINARLLRCRLFNQGMTADRVRTVLEAVAEAAEDMEYTEMARELRAEAMCVSDAVWVLDPPPKFPEEVKT